MGGMREPLGGRASRPRGADVDVTRLRRDFQGRPAPAEDRGCSASRSPVKQLAA